jgi:FkbM family methyltransferase
MFNMPDDRSLPLLIVESGISVEALRLTAVASHVAASDLVGVAAKEAHKRDVICITGARHAALALSNIPGVVPVLLTDEIGSNVLSDPSIANVHDISKLTAYFDPGTAGPFLGLSRWRPSDTRAELARRTGRLLEAARKAGGITIYGAGTIGRQAADAARLVSIPVKAIFDANEKLHGSFVNGVEVRPASSLERGVDVVVPALGRHIAAITALLEELGAQSIMSLSELYYISRRPGEPETDYLDDLFANRNRYHSLFMAMADRRSREVLSAVLKHRLSLATHHLADVAEHGHPQWFDPAFLPRTDRDVFVDGGAYDGDTAIGYDQARGSGYRHVHAFEIDQDVAASALKRTAHLPNVTIHNCGLSDRNARVSYRKTGGTDGSIAGDVDSGNYVKLQTIDSAVAEPITFLKLDVEGEEAKAIEGARQHLICDRPTVAVALYHKAHDLWDIPRRLLDILPDYQLHFRHYTDLAYETIVYANPHELARSPETDFARD